MAERAELSFESGERSLSVRRFSVHEALSRPFEVNLVAESADPAIDLSSIVGKRAGFLLEGVAEAAQIRAWNGVCSHMALLQSETEGLSTYLVRIVPELWLLTQRRGSRIFQRKTLLEIVQQLMSEWRIEPKLKLSAHYEKHDFVVQYDETDFDFVSRLCERAGITYLFDFASQNKTELTLADAPHLGEVRALAPLYHPRPPEVHGGAFVTRVLLSQAVRPGGWVLRDFDWRRPPDYALVGKAEPSAPPEDCYELYHYEPGAMLRVDPSDGGGESMPTADDKGKVRTSEKAGKAAAVRALGGERAGRRCVRFETNCNDLAPGRLFRIAEHPRHDLGSDKTLLMTAFVLEGYVGQRWIYRGEAVESAQPWLPALRTPRPRIHGVQSAVVVGRRGEEIHTDETGRVRVQFHWDREGNKNDDSSCWIRVSQDWAGAGYGSLLIPRVGQEVLVAFLEGDPEQPLVVGRVYNEEQRVPYELPKHKTRSGWRSDSSPGSGGFNEILLEDKQGGEIVYYQAERDLQKLTKREEVERIAHDRTVLVGKSRKAVVKTVDATMVGQVSVRQIMAPADKKKLKIVEQEVPALSPRDTTVEMKANRVVLTTGQATVAFDGASIAFEANGNITLNAKGNDVILEGTRAFINTMPPPSAPQPDPVPPIEPGTFSSKS